MLNEMRLRDAKGLALFVPPFRRTKKPERLPAGRQEAEPVAARAGGKPQKLLLRSPIKKQSHKRKNYIGCPHCQHWVGKACGGNGCEDVHQHNVNAT